MFRYISTRLKYSQISPIFKRGDKTVMTNYRPISLLTSFSNIFEKVIYNRVQYHIDTNNILAQEQYGVGCRYMKRQPLL
jgi:sarcosine oxidase/L-pipecolate oxidase